MTILAKPQQGRRISWASWWSYCWAWGCRCWRWVFEDVPHMWGCCLFAEEWVCQSRFCDLMWSSIIFLASPKNVILRDYGAFLKISLIICMHWRYFILCLARGLALWTEGRKTRADLGAQGRNASWSMNKVWFLCLNPSVCVCVRISYRFLSMHMYLCLDCTAVQADACCQDCGKAGLGCREREKEERKKAVKVLLRDWNHVLSQVPSSRRSSLSSPWSDPCGLPPGG